MSYSDIKYELFEKKLIPSAPPSSPTCLDKKLYQFEKVPPSFPEYVSAVNKWYASSICSFDNIVNIPLPSSPI